MAALHLVAAALLCIMSLPCGRTQCERTPANFSGRYIQECGKILPDDANCLGYWNTFQAAFARRDPAQVTASDYNPYFQLEPFQLGENTDTTLFWSRTVEIGRMLSKMTAAGANVISSFNSPGTAIVNNVNRDPEDEDKRIEVYWCGTTDGSSEDGIDYTSMCNCSVAGAFFGQFSMLFARAARGTAFYLTSGEEEDGAFRNDSFFATAEIPNLSPAGVNRIVVMVVHRRGAGESCGEGSLITLEQNLTATLGPDFTYTCIDLYGNPKNDADAPALTQCAMNVVETIQEGSEPESSMDCSSALPGVQLSILAIAVALVISVFA